MPASNNVTPLPSSLLEQEPELIDLIKKYVNKYPAMICDIQSAYEKKSIDEVHQRLHDLKSTGGNYGFMIISELAIKAKAFLDDGDAEAVEATLSELKSLQDRMSLSVAGFKE